MRIHRVAIAHQLGHVPAHNAAGQNRQLTSERPNVASSAAMAKSQAQSCVKAPPKQKPFTMAMVGLAYFDNFSQRQ